MNKTIGIMILTLILSGITVYGVTFSELGDEAIAIWAPNGNISTDSSDFNHLINFNGGAIYDTSNFVTAPASGRFDDTTDDPLVYPVDSSHPLGTYESVTMCIWTNVSRIQETSERSHLFSNINSGGTNNGGISLQWDGFSDEIQATYIHGGFMSITANYGVTNPETAEYNQYCIVINESGGTGFITLYENQTQRAQGSAALSLASTTQDMIIGDSATSGRIYEGGLDCFSVYNRSISETEINTLYTNGVAGNCPNVVPAAAQPTITIDFPSNNLLTANANPIDINWTITVDESLQVDNVSIFINGTLNKTVFTSDNTNIDIGEGNFQIYAIVFDNASQSTQSATNSFKVDRTNPFDDLTTVIPPGTEVTEDTNFTITASNTNLFGHNVTVIAPNGSIAFSQEVLNISQPTNQITIPVSIESYGVGTFTVNSSESDDHTANQIPDFVEIPDIVNKRLTYQTPDNTVMIQLQVAEASSAATTIDILPQLNAISSTKLFDRYIFGFDFTQNNPAFTEYHYEMLVTAQHQIWDRDTEYFGHLVTKSNWIDFEPFDVQIERLDQYNVRIILDTNTNEINFESIGGVNFGSSVTTFTIPTPPTEAQTFSTNVIAWGTVLLTLGVIAAILIEMIRRRKK